MWIGYVLPAGSMATGYICQSSMQSHQATCFVAAAAITSAGGVNPRSHGASPSPAEQSHGALLELIKSCGKQKNLHKARRIHAQILQSQVLDPQDASCSAISFSLLQMYSDCGAVTEAQKVLDQLLLPTKTKNHHRYAAAAWSLLIKMYAQHGHGERALQCFQKMQENGKEPSLGILVSVLKACSTVAALEQGKQVHKQVVHKGRETDTFIGTALIDMYAKCGSIEDASTVFRALPNPDIVTWSTIITCFAQNNDYKSALKFFDDMQIAGFQPNEVTFTCLLSACSHSGRLKEGCEHFKSMKEKYNIAPTLEHHYVLMEIFGHEALFDEAEDLIESVPFCSNVVGWMSLLTLCGQHGNINLGRRCFDRAIGIKPGYSSGYALMWNLYNQAGMCDEARRIDDLRIIANAWKKPAKAFIEVDNQVHSFIVADKSHPQSDRIYTKLKDLTEKIKSEGYSPSLGAVPDWSSDRDKEVSLCRHSEKLAIAFGLISTAKGATIRLSKNLRVCADCHSAAKVISKVEMREIIITDAYQIHRFKDGTCSCQNFG